MDPSLPVVAEQLGVVDQDLMFDETSLEDESSKPTCPCSFSDTALDICQKLKLAVTDWFGRLSKETVNKTNQINCGPPVKVLAGPQIPLTNFKTTAEKIADLRGERTRETIRIEQEASDQKSQFLEEYDEDDSTIGWEMDFRVDKDHEFDFIDAQRDGELAALNTRINKVIQTLKRIDPNFMEMADDSTEIPAVLFEA